ncbi:MAG TPA: ABC transporter substrate-binding protein [Pusillimonas sp.]|uniref:ABC transporter substrate-binding protein n=1 Tax=Pusillimonas sp. TaxID=3040095 RepID=UPI002B4B833C|nr:ABC transporter substrate-binding protein [Pusillimonas sp.]HLU20056.1 ABC transporter substrate-binding protein [Pusillimonas sp.]
MKRKQLLAALCAGVFAVSSMVPWTAQAKEDTVKVGLILSMTGAFASTGIQIEQGARLFMKQHGDTVAGKKIELVIKDDTGAPDQARRVAQELVVQDQVDVLGGFVLTPLALATAQVSTRSKTPTIVMVAATSSVINASPYFVRSSFTMPQVTIGVAEWAPANGIKNVATLVSDYGPGIDAEKAFIERFEANGGTIVESIRVPLQNPDFAPFLQRVRNQKPDAVFVFLPAGVGTQFMKQFADRGLAEAGVRLLATGDVVEDDILNGMGDVALDVVTSHHYSAAHPSELNKKFVQDFKEAYNGRRPNYMAVAAYDGMKLLYNALEATGGKTGDELLEAMKGQKFESPRGPIHIEADTRDIVQNVYIRRVERLDDGELYNVEFDVLEQVRDPGQSK